MPQVDQIEQHSEEVQDIMGRIPGSLIRRGLTVIFLIFFMIIVGSYFFRFREIVSAPMIITTTNPPAPLICKASGRIARWFVTDGQKVNEGESIALIKNSTALEDMVLIEKIILKLDSSAIRSQVKQVILPEKLILGDLQETWNLFCRNWKNYRDYLENDFLNGKIDLLGQEMQKQQQYYQLALEQQKMMQQELALAEKGLQRHQAMLAKGGISESQMEEAQSAVIQSKRSYSAFMASLKSTEISLISQKRALLEMQEQDQTNVEQYELNIADNLRSLKNQVKSWKDNYLLSSPIEGTVTLTKFWSENHVVASGERLATIIPRDNKGVICRAKVPSSGIGKVEAGQKVNIKLSGFPYMEHGILTGEVSAVSLVPEENSYMVEIRVNDSMQSTYREQLTLVQEMEGTADIITRENRLLVRFISPLRTLLDKEE